MRVIVMFSTSSAREWVERLNNGGVDAQVGYAPLIVNGKVDKFPRETHEVCYLVTTPIAAIRSTIPNTAQFYKLPDEINASSLLYIKLSDLVPVA